MLRIPARPEHPRLIVRGRLVVQLPKSDISRKVMAVIPRIVIAMMKMIFDVVVFFILSFSFSVCHGWMIACA
jgi:hypothetical protein